MGQNGLFGIKVMVLTLNQDFGRWVFERSVKISAVLSNMLFHVLKVFEAKFVFSKVRHLHKLFRSLSKNSWTLGQSFSARLSKLGFPCPNVFWKKFIFEKNVKRTHFLTLSEKFSGHWWQNFGEWIQSSILLVQGNKMRKWFFPGDKISSIFSSGLCCSFILLAWGVFLENFFVLNKNYFCEPFRKLNECLSDNKRKFVCQCCQYSILCVQRNVFKNFLGKMNF